MYFGDKILIENKISVSNPRLNMPNHNYCTSWLAICLKRADSDKENWTSQLETWSCLNVKNEICKIYIENVLFYCFKDLANQLAEFSLTLALHDDITSCSLAWYLGSSRREWPGSILANFALALLSKRLFWIDFTLVIPALRGGRVDLNSAWCNNSWFKIGYLCISCEW